MEFEQISKIPKIFVKRKMRYGELLYDFIDSPYTLSFEKREELTSVVYRYKLLRKIDQSVFSCGCVSGHWWKVSLDVFYEFVEEIKAILCDKSNWVENLCPICKQPITGCRHWANYMLRRNDTE